MPTPVVDESGREVEAKSLDEYLNEGRTPGDTYKDGNEVR